MFIDHQGALSKLTQILTLAIYHTAFESLANRTQGLSASFLLSCYISILQPDLRRKVLAFQPTILSHAMGLAKLQEDKYKDIRRFPYRQLTPSSKPPLLPNPSTPSPLPPPLRPPICQLTHEEMHRRREHGLCFNCDEKYSRGHRCSKRQFLLLLSEDDIPDFPSPPFDNSSSSLSPPEPETDLLSSEISLHALAGHPSPRTLRIVGSIHGHLIQSHVDSGSTHNFLQDRVARHLNLLVDASSLFSVTVGNGKTLRCSGICAATPIVVADHPFSLDLCILPLHGADIILGVQWLEDLGPVTFDYSNMRVSFTLNNQPITLLR